MAGRVVLVQGASRGLGLHFCKHILSARKEAKVIAICRNPQAATALQALYGLYPQELTILQLGATREAEKQSQRSMASWIHSSILGQYCTPAPEEKPACRRSQQRWARVSVCGSICEDLSITLATNTIGPLVMAKYFAPLLLKGSGAFGHQFADQAKQHRAILVNLTAKVGSIGDNADDAAEQVMDALGELMGRGPVPSWRTGRELAQLHLNGESDSQGWFLFTSESAISSSAGTVNTDLSKPYHRNVPKDKLFTSECSVNFLMNIIENLDMGKTGKFFASDGSTLPCLKDDTAM